MREDDELAQYFRQVIQSLERILGDVFLGLYVYGSLVTDAFVPDRSDIDALGIVALSMTNEARMQVRDGVADIVLPPGVRGLDLSIASSANAWKPNEQACWELVLQVSRTSSGQRTVQREPCDPRLPLDLALARQQGVVLAGRPIDAVIGSIPPSLVLRACSDNVRRWAARDVFSDASSGVLNACRAWQYLEEGTLGSKVGGGQWALAQGGHRDLIQAALARHRGEQRPFPPDAEVKRFFQTVLALLEADTQ